MSSKASIFQIGTIDGDTIDGWGFDCGGMSIDKTDWGKDSLSLGWTREELEYLANEFSIKPELRKYMKVCLAETPQLKGCYCTGVGQRGGLQ